MEGGSQGAVEGAGRELKLYQITSKLGQIERTSKKELDG